MRFLGVGDWNDLGSIYLSLVSDGHEVRVYIGKPEGHDILGGMVARVDDWRSSLEWIRAAGRDGIILFETATMGALQDELRRDGFHVVGGSAIGDRLEQDRSFGQTILDRCGMRTIPTWSFPDSQSAAEFVRLRPGRYVLKYDGDADLLCQTFAGRAQGGEDVLALLAARGPRKGPHLIMAHVDGVEVGIGAYFNGEHFLMPACLDWEHKRFFPGDIGELTGEMGTLVTYAGSEPLFERTLARLAPFLRESLYRGYINLNTIVNASGIWPLELTSRFGYPGSAILGVLQPDGWADLFQRICDPCSHDFAVDPGFALGVVLSVPPFPYSEGYERLGKGTRIAFAGARPEDAAHFHFGEIALIEGETRCAGLIGAIMTVTGRGFDAAAARDDAYARIGKVVIPNLRYRNDIGKRFLESDGKQLRDWGFLGPPARATLRSLG